MAKKYRKTIPRILVCLDPSLGQIAAIQQGIQRYAKLYGPWKLDYVIDSEKNIAEQVQGMTKTSYSGVLARIQQQRFLAPILNLKFPTVLIDPPPEYLNSKTRTPRSSFVSLDTANIGKLTVDHFLSANIQHFGYVPSLPGTAWSRNLEKSFYAELKTKGIGLDVYSSPTESITRKHFVNWIQKRQKPIALFVSGDHQGRDILNICHEAKLAVPYEVLVLAVGNDEIFCESCFPSLSSILVHWQRGGFSAAECLDQIMQRKQPRPEVYDAFEVVERDSTRQITRPDKTSGLVANNCVIRALEFIRINSGFCIQVEDVARHAGVSRQWLEKRFKSDLGHSVLEDIRRHRIERIKSLLVETDLTIVRIAEMSGYESANHLRIIFKKECKMSMTEYRNRYRKNN